MSMTKSLHWDITKNCNLRCMHCYNAEKYFNINSEAYMKSEMNLEQCIYTVEYFSKAGFSHIHFLGGEPLTSPYLFDVIKRAKDLNMTITINSNACLLTDDVQQKLIDYGVNQFAASLDGCTALINDSIRGDGTFERVVSNMMQLNAKKEKNDSALETALVFTLTKKNLRELTLLPSLANRIGVDLITLTTFIESGQGKNNSEMFQIDYNSICDAIDTMVAEELTKYNIPLQIDMRPRFCEYLSDAHTVPIIYNLKNSLCCAGEDMWYLEANGNVHPCLAFQLESGKSAIRNGVYKKENININDVEFEIVENSEYWRSFLKAKHSFSTDKISTCKDCRYIDKCLPCFLDYGNYDSKIMECEWTKKKEISLYEEVASSAIVIYKDVSFDNENCIISKAGEPVLLLDSLVSNDIWRMINENKSPYDIVEVLAREYDVDQSLLKYDVAAFLTALRGNKVISY